MSWLNTLTDLLKAKRTADLSPNGDEPTLEMNPALSEEDICAFEDEHKISLPQSYRTFLRTVGDGGTGLGRRRLNPLKRTIETLSIDRFGPYYEPAAPFPHSTYLQLNTLPDQLPSCYLDDEPYDWVDLADMNYEANTGRLGLVDCTVTNMETYQFILIVNGPCKGQVWWQKLYSGPIAPLDAKTGASPDFGRWYSAWIAGETWGLEWAR